MSTNFPTSLDTLTNPTSTDSVNTVSHSSQHANANDAIEALQAKVGADSSAVTTSHDYKLSEVTSTDKAVGKTATQTLTNKTLTSPTITTPSITGGNFTSGTMVTGIINGTTAISLGSDATGDTYYRDANGNLKRLAIGNDTQVLQVSSGVPTWATPTNSINSTGGISFGPASSTTQVITHGLGRVPVTIRIHGIGQQAGGQGVPVSHGHYTSSGNNCVYMPQSVEAVIPIKSSTFSIRLEDNSNSATGVVQNITSSTFGIVWTSSGDVSGQTVFTWEAQ